MSDAENVPSWVPEIAPGVRADVYPVEPPRPTRTPFCESPQELVLDRQAVTAGYAERRLPYEFASCLPLPPTSFGAPSLSSAVPGAAPPPFNPASGDGLSHVDLSKLRTGIAVLRRSRPTKLQRIELHTFAHPATSQDAADGLPDSSASKKAFPLQKPSGSSTLEDWFNKLSSSPNFNTSELSRSVPLGPAIVRATGKVIEMMATRDVPAQRAAWYIRIAVLNECIKQMRPGRPPPSAKVFWTRQLCGLLKTEIKTIREKRTNILGAMDRLLFWDYVLDLARWQLDDSLLDCKQWLSQIAAVLYSELLACQAFSSPGTKIAVSAARRFLPEFLASASNAQMLLDSLLPGASAIVKAWRGAPATAIKGNSAGGGGQAQGKRDKKAAPRKGSVKHSQFTPNLCHREVTMLLSASVRVLDHSIIGNPDSETRMSDLERFVKRGVAIVRKNKIRNDGPEPGKMGDKASFNRNPLAFVSGVNELVSPHRVIRELEMLPGHGDLSKITEVLRKAFENRNGLRGAVEEVCRWTVDGPVSDKAEAICVGSAVIMNLADQCCMVGGKGLLPPRQSRLLNQDIHKPHFEANDPSWMPPLQREIWDFLKSFAKDKKPHVVERDDRLVRFVAQLCRMKQLSLRVLVRDISRLSSYGHPGTAYLVKCLALLPDPVDQNMLQKDSASVQGLDCRRALLRKFGYVANGRFKNGKVSEQVLEAVFSGDMAQMELEAHKVNDSGDTNSILTTAELVRARYSGTWLDTSSNIQSKIYTMTSFLLLVGEPVMAVEWLLGTLSDIVSGQGNGSAGVSSQERQNKLLIVIVSLLEDVSRYIAACGLLEVLFLVLKKAYLSPWVTHDGQKRILLTCAAFSKLFSSNWADGSLYWARMAVRHMQHKNEGISAAKNQSLALACVRGQVKRNPAESVDLQDISKWKREAASVAGDYVQSMIVDQVDDAELTEIRTIFSESEDGFPLESYFARGFTASDLFGNVFIPVLIHALRDSNVLRESNEGDTECRFSKLVVFSLQLIDSRQNDVRFQGVRPPLLVEFISLIVAGCFSENLDTGVSLDVLIGMKWVWKILAPRAGIQLAKMLRARVEYHCNISGTEDAEVLLALLFNMVTRFSGDSDRNKPMEVAGSLGKEPFGMIDMQVALLAAHRKECKKDEEFGTQMGEAAVSLICPDSARTLASSVLRSCTDEEWKHVVVGVIGYSAAMAMADSLGYVVAVFTVEVEKNNALHQERAAQWNQADSARRGILECVVESLSEEVGSQVETALFDQLVSATTLLNEAQDRGSMPSSLLGDGCRVSDALESRLKCILRSQRTPLNAETWAKRTTDVAELLHSAVPLLTRSAIAAALNLLTLCVKNLLDCERPSDEASGSSGKATNPILDAVGDDELKGQVIKLLRPVLCWLERADEKPIDALIEDRSVFGLRQNGAIRAFNATGTEIDNWLLLEGYGRGGDEEAAVPPLAFGKQGLTGGLEGVAPVVQLKRTYSTFASLAV